MSTIETALSLSALVVVTAAIVGGIVTVAAYITAVARMVPIGAGTEAAAVARPAFSVTETSPRGAA